MDGKTDTLVFYEINDEWKEERQDRCEQEVVSGSARKALEKSKVSYLCICLFLKLQLCSWHYTQTGTTDINNIQTLPSRSMQSY